MQLNWLVCEALDCNGVEPLKTYEGNGRKWIVTAGGFTIDYSTAWAQGGPIIERESICLDKPEMSHQWIADKRSGVGRLYRQYGPTLLIAAMRCFVASKLGDIVEVPDDLLANSS